MYTCKNCGAQLTDEARRCPSCGAVREAASKSDDFSAKVAQLNNTADTTDAFDRNDITANKAMAILAYFGPLVLIPILAAKESKFARFHSNQGLVLLITSAIVQVAAEIVPLVGWLVGLVGGIFVFACFLKGMINVYHLEKKELPYIGSFKLLK